VIAPQRAAIAHDWFALEAGAERVALEFTRLLPSAPIYTTFFDPSIFGGEIAPARVHTWPLQRLLGPSQHFRSFLPLYPAWFSMLDLRAYDVVVSSSVAFTHAVRTRRDAVHVAYVYTPIRYAWDLDAYLAGSGWSPIARLGARAMQPFLKRWDRAAGQKPDVVVAISSAVRDRIRRHWGRDAEVIHPPVEVDGIRLSATDDGYLIIASRMLAYRRIDLAIAACTRLGRELIVLGDGPERARLERMAGPSVRFLGWVDRATQLDLLASCHAYLVPGIEDFGLAPVEAMAAGKPVVAFRGGGSLDTVVDGTGVFFDEQSPASMIEAIEQLDGTTFDAGVIRRNAERFSVAVFHQRFAALFERLGVDPALYQRHE
jgi:glycosyltransferase involved in cell wall biosynthesis